MVKYQFAAVGRAQGRGIPIGVQGVGVAEYTLGSCGAITEPAPVDRFIDLDAASNMVPDASRETDLAEPQSDLPVNSERLPKPTRNA